MQAFIAEQAIDKTGNWKIHLPKPPLLTFDERTYYWTLRTNKGVVKIQLKPKVAPMHVSSTIYLTQLGFYDGIPFHRVIPEFMAQGGDPLGNGSGSPGYAYDGEFDPDVRHNRGGLLSMANRGPGTDGSQFFLTFQPTPWLDDKHTIFGEVVDGMDTLRALEACGTKPKGVTTEPLSIEAAVITAE
ncbi:MAG: peptidylprolyl isomerase [Planctomycetota bacterium]